MSSEQSRREFGMTDRGQVVLITKRHFEGPNGDVPVDTFEVRHGVRTVGQFKSEKAASTVASALAGAVEEQ